MKKSVIYTTIILSLLVCSIPSWGQTLKDLKNELNKSNKTINKKVKQLNVVKEEKREISQQIELLDRQIDTASAKINDLKSKISNYSESIEEKEDQIKQAEEKIAVLDELLKARLVALYKNGEETYIEVILDSESISDFFARYYFVKTVVEQDKKLLDSTAETKKIIENVKLSLETQKKDIENAKQNRMLAKENLDTYRGNRNSYLRKLSYKQQGLEAAIDEEIRESKQIEEKIKRIQKGSKVVYSGKGFVWPVDATHRVSSPFGMRMHPILHKKKMHTGVDISAKYGVDIVAVNGGKVIFSDWYGGYGKAVIIDHGNGKSSLYAHASKLCVKEGEEVKKGEKIAEVGSTGLSTGPHLHFEIRENGKPVNPMNYISK